MSPANHEPNLVKQAFDAAADGYDSPALRFFATAATHLASRLALRGDEHVLDLACGTGHLAVALARRLPRGRVTAVDFSPGMLTQARRKAEAAGLGNLDFVECDMQALAWSAKFDVAVCAFGLFFVEDMQTQLARIAATVKPGGQVAMSNFAEGYMDPLRALMVERFKQFGVVPPPQIWMRIARPEDCHRLFASAGLGDIQVERQELGYFLSSADEWWEVIWNTGFRRTVARLAPAEQARFKAQHLAEIEALRTPAGVRMEVGVLFTTGRVPGG